MSETFVEVLLDQNLDRPLDYRVPANVPVQVGMRVEVPLKSTLKKGTIFRIKTSTSFPGVKLISRLLSPRQELSKAQWDLAEWMSKYYLSPMQRVLKCFIPTAVRKEVEKKKEIRFRLCITHDACIAEIQKLRTKAPLQAEALETVLNSEKGVIGSTAALNALVKKKLLQRDEVEEDDLLDAEFFPSFPKSLNSEQESCLTSIYASLAEQTFSTHLIHGVTGSGKTEVYMQAIQKTLDRGKSAILLVPEISLTSQTIERFRSRFSEKIAILHHRRSLGERGSDWQDLQTGKIRLVIGARSALFCPAQNLGLIILDEEHDSSYKQSDESPCYHGRDTAVMRARFENCTLLLGSATPSLESRYNAEIGKYKLHELKTRATSASLPKVQIIDMKKTFEKAKGFTHFSDELLDAMKKRLQLGEQTLLLLNRRGYRRQLLCASCREVSKCPHCDLALAFHKEVNLLQCHLCDHKAPPPRNCPSCNASESLEYKGFGTEHVENTLHALLPEARTLRMDRDTTTKKNSHEEIFKQFRAHKADVLIGTQMIAKGFHFPSVTLVGVLNPDSALSIPDFRAAEQMFQLLTQVAGRAGRAELAGVVILQTLMPDHPILHLAAAQDYASFYLAERAERHMFRYPPFARLVKLLFSDPDEEVARSAAAAAYAEIASRLPPDTQLLPVVPAGHAKIKDLYRFQFIIKTLKISTLQPILAAHAKQAKIDVDPISIYF